MNNPVSWLKDKLFEEYPELINLTVKNHPEMTPNQWVTGRINWGVTHRLTFFWADCRGVYGAIMFRPVNDWLLTDINYDYWGTIFDYDPEGDICLVDFAYGPGLYPQMIELCAHTGRERIAWQHRKRNHVVPIARMPRKSLHLVVH